MKKTYILIVLAFYISDLFAQDSVSILKPLIGISCSHSDNQFSSVGRTYTESVLKAGGLPVLIPVMEKEQPLAEIVSLLDGLLLIGGEDVHPRYYNEEPVEELGKVDDVRDLYDLSLIRLATERGLPVFGICRGEQLINVAFGGSLYQDIPSQYNDSTVKHYQNISSKFPTHYIDILPGSVIATIIGESELATNSFHHQAVKQVAPGFRITAWSCDNIPEAIEACDGRPIWGVQFHPEEQTFHDNPVMTRFFKFFTHQALLFREKRNNSCSHP